MQMVNPLCILDTVRFLFSRIYLEAKQGGSELSDTNGDPVLASLFA